jgi:alanine-synthesizing transaminase
VELPAGIDDEAFALRALEEQSVILQPGYMFDMEDAQAAVVSLLPPPEVFEEGISRIAELLREPSES